MEIVEVERTRIREDGSQYGEQTCSSDTRDTTPGEHHGHVLCCSRKSAAYKEEHQGKLQCKVAAIDVGEGCEKGQEDGRR